MSSRQQKPRHAASRRTRPPFTWHYYAMAVGALAMLMAAVLSAWSAVAAAFGFVVISYPGLKFVGLTRQVILVFFALIYVFAFPTADEVRRHFSDDNAALAEKERKLGLKQIVEHETCLFCVCPSR